MRHTQAIILAAVLLAGIVSGGCTRIHSAEELTKDTRPETTRCSPMPRSWNSPQMG